MANTGFLSSTELDFDSLKSSLRTFLSSQTAFQDYDFEGSNLSYLLDVLAYNTLMNAQYLNFVGSEMFLDSALTRETVVSHAKSLNYLPRSRSSASVSATITIVPSDSPASITIPKNYAIKTVLDGTTYSFVSEEAVVVKNNNGSYVSNAISFYEGEVVTERFTANVTVNSDGTYNSYRFVLSSENIDSDSIEVSVQNSASDTTTATWTRATSLYDLTSLSKVFFVEGYSDNEYQVVFGNDVLGKALENGNIVTITYRDTVGDDVNGALVFTKGASISGYSSISVSVAAAATGGAERESISSIKYNAPRHFQTQERAVTAADFESLVLANYPSIQAVTAYGGEEASPPQYGKVFISLKPNGTVGTVSNALKTDITNFLRLKNMTTEPEVVDPEYFYIKIDTEVQYNPTLTTLTPNQIKTNVVANLVAMNTTSLNDFGKDFRYSKALAVIDSSANNNAIVSNDTEVKMIKRWAPTTGSTNALSFSFGNALKSEGVRYEYPAGHESIISSSSFTYTKDGTDYTSYLKDDGLGTMTIFTIGSDDSDVELNEDIGTVDYDTGEIQISANVKSYTNNISIYAALESKDILVSSNKFLIIDSADITVTVVEERD